MNKILGSMILRFSIIIMSILFQLFLWAFIIVLFGQYDGLAYNLLLLLSISGGVVILIQDTYPEGKIPWIIIMFIMPFLGGILFFTFGLHHTSKKTKKLYKEINEDYQNSINKIESLDIEKLNEDSGTKSQFRYLKKYADAPVYENTKIEYYPLGEDMLESMLKELEKAQEYIFMEYFIIEEGLMWGQIEKVLEEKAQNGLDVRVMFDDFGCIGTLEPGFIAKLRNKKIKCYAYNKVRHAFNSNFNNRDHRKICVIDGNTGFTGGINLADEYINKKVKHGHWKDTALMIKGDAVFSLTMMFLSMWGYTTQEVESFLKFKPNKVYESDGFVQPFSDSPNDDEAVGENIYMSILNKADEYVYITSPYLIISREMMVSLMQSAKSGVDVRLILPAVADKKFVHFLSRSYYSALIKAGVKIFEYTPGFIHAKMFISDDVKAVVGTINLDFRSLNLHFECGVFMYKSSVIQTIKEDFLKTQAVSKEITLDNLPYKMNVFKYAMLGLLRAFSPLF